MGKRLRFLLSASGSGNERIFHRLERLGLDINLLDDRGWTPIIWAARYGHTPIVKHLLEAGVEIFRPDRQWRSALHWAAVEGHVDVVGLLVDCMIEAGLDVHFKVRKAKDFESELMSCFCVG